MQFKLMSIQRHSNWLKKNRLILVNLWRIRSHLEIKIRQWLKNLNQILDLIWIFNQNRIKSWRRLFLREWLQKKVMNLNLSLFILKWLLLRKYFLLKMKRKRKKLFWTKVARNQLMFLNPRFKLKRMITIKEPILN